MKPYLSVLREIVASRELATAAEISNHCIWTVKTTTERLAELKRAGMIDRIRIGFKVFWFTPENSTIAESRRKLAQERAAERARKLTRDRDHRRRSPVKKRDVSEVKQRIVPAAEAKPVRTRAVRSVFELWEKV